MIDIFKKKKKEASRLVGLDIALKVSSFVTGKEHLHYGLWEKLDVTLENLGKAQEAYTNLLFKYCLLYTSPSPRDKRQSRMPSSA